MAEESLITDEIRSLVGKASEPVIMEVERGAIKRWAVAIEDPNLLYNDVEYAKKTKYGELICPPGFFGWPVKPGPQPIFTVLDTLEKAGLTRVLDGGMEYEFMLPIRAGDTLTSVGKVVNIAERQTKAGKMLFTIYETTYVNQNGDLVAKSRGTTINFK